MQYRIEFLDDANSIVRAQPAAEFEARDAGKHPVEDDEVERALGQAKLGLVAPLHALDDVALRLEIVGEQNREV
jgi:hypothetical protein